MSVLVNINHDFYEKYYLESCDKLDQNHVVLKIKKVRDEPFI